MNSGLRVHFPRLLLYNATCGSGSKLLLLHNISTVGSQMTGSGYDYSRLIWSDSKTVICCCGMCSDALSCVPNPQPPFPHQPYTHTHSHTVPCLSKLEDCQHVCSGQTRTHTPVINISLFPSIPPYFIPLSYSPLPPFPILPIPVLILVIRTIFTSSSQTEFQCLPVSLFLSVCLYPSHILLIASSSLAS